MRSTKAKHEIILNMDTRIAGETLCYDFCWKSVRIATITFSRHGKSEKSNPIMEWLVSFLCLLGCRMKLVFRAKLSHEEKNIVCDLFPYISRYKGIRDFCERFSAENESFPYDEYDECSCVFKRLRECPHMDQQWRAMRGDNGSLFMAVCWRDNKNEHNVVVLNERVACSNVSPAIIAREELKGELSYICEENVRFVAEQYSVISPNIMLDAYLDGGGRLIFHFLRARTDNNCIFELLGKSGLGVLADKYLANEFKELNTTETTPSKIFGIPIKLLRYLNDNYDMVNMETAQERASLAFVWKAYPELFLHPMKPIDVMWINYYQKAGEDPHFQTSLLFELPFRQTLQYLHKRMDAERMNDYVVFALYENYVILSHRLGDFRAKRFPQDLERAVKESVDCLNEILEMKKMREFVAMVHTDGYQKWMEDISEENYLVEAPNSTEEILEAGRSLHNCLPKYKRKILSGEVCIGLVYHRQNERKHLIGAVEIKRETNALLQAKGYCNAEFQGEEQDYVLAYAKRKKLNLSRCKDLNYGLR